MLGVYSSGQGPMTKRASDAGHGNLGVLGMGAAWHGVHAPRVVQRVVVKCLWAHLVPCSDDSGQGKGWRLRLGSRGSIGTRAY